MLRVGLSLTPVSIGSLEKEVGGLTSHFSQDTFRDPNDSTWKPVFLTSDLPFIGDKEKGRTQKTPMVPAEQNGARSGWIIPLHQRYTGRELTEHPMKLPS
jgi:hypothetical protein